MNKPLSSLALLGLSPSAFRLVHEDEMTADHDAGAAHHSDGSVCSCPTECREWLDAHWWPLVDAARLPH